MLVGHSGGGIVAVQLATDPSFNGARVAVTHVVAAGAPISGAMAVLTRQRSAARALSVENVNDVVTRLDGVDSLNQPQTARNLAYQYSDDQHGVVRNHAAD